jgi:hypothetical protein
MATRPPRTTPHAGWHWITVAQFETFSLKLNALEERLGDLQERIHGATHDELLQITHDHCALLIALYKDVEAFDHLVSNNRCRFALLPHVVCITVRQRDVEIAMRTLLSQICRHPTLSSRRVLNGGTRLI